MEDGVEKSVDDRVVKQEENRKMGMLYKMKGCEMMIVRFMGVVLSLAATVVAGVDEESRIISLATLAPCLPPLDLSVTAKWHYLSSTVYLVVANAIACTYAAASLLLCFGTWHSKRNTTTLPLLISDLIMVALLFSANGAAIGVGLIALYGNSHTHWHKLCYLFHRIYTVMKTDAQEMGSKFKF
ncbi:hypothetical protein POM88_050283 [Heracleum sosnowskyi]|uniref:CASP-like protein n=1 Tax=Heracleum sosnowskyi TaxID=360622 RepID=A0AAD8GZR5_9APIA|nr:hypothetical protein POM88_050283 [Heracleum sosnowskyi]